MNSFFQIKIAVAVCSFILLILLAPGCKTPAEIKKSASGSSPDSILFKYLNPPDIHFFSGRAKIAFSDGEKDQKAVMFIRTRKDSVVWMIFKKVSVEGGRVLINADSLYFVNRIDKEYYQTSIDTINKQYGIESDFNYLQNSIFGLPAMDVNPQWPEMKITGKDIRLTTFIKGVEHEFIYNKKSGLYTGGRILENGRSTAQWTLGDYRLVNDSLEIPFFRQYNFQRNKNESIILTLNYTDIEINEPKTIRFEIPPDYMEIK